MVDLEARDVSVAYGSADVLHGASLRLENGTVTSLVGPNGSGKSTMLKSIARLQQPRSGVVTLRTDDTEVDGLLLTRKEFARQVALLTQGRPVPSGLRVRDVVGFGRYPYESRFGGKDTAGTAVVESVLELTGLTSFADRAVDQLSGGQLQRVWLASCLAQQTGVLLLDEPTTYLDLRYQVELFDLIRDLATVDGTAVGVVLHDLDQAAAVADRVVLLDSGTVVADGTPEEVFTSERLSAVYGIRIDVDHDPSTRRLRTRAVGRHHTRTERLHSTP